MEAPFYKLQCIHCNSILPIHFPFSCSCGVAYTEEKGILEAFEGPSSPSSFSQLQVEQLEEMETFHFWSRARRSFILQRLKAFSSGKRILDIGCGTGGLVNELARCGYEVVGVDLQREGLVKRKREESSLHLIQASAERLPFCNGQFDVAILADVLEHLAEERVLQEAFRVLKPGGFLLLTVPAFPWAWSERDRQAGHLRRYLPSQIRSLAAQFGGKVIDLGFYQFFLFPIFLISRILNANPKKEIALPRWINRMFLAVNNAEVWLGRWIRWPWGSSIFALVKKNGQSI